MYASMHGLQRTQPYPQERNLSEHQRIRTPTQCKSNSGQLTPTTIVEIAQMSCVGMPANAVTGPGSQKVLR